jgi:hypothetical protein
MCFKLQGHGKRGGLWGPPTTPPPQKRQKSKFSITKTKIIRPRTFFRVKLHPNLAFSLKNMGKVFKKHENGVFSWHF